MEAKAQNASPSNAEARLRQQVLNDYRQSSLPVQEIARKHKVGTGRVIKWAKEAGLTRPRGRPRLPDTVIAAALEDLRRERGSLQEIAERHGISSRTLRTRAHEAGVPTQSQDDQQSHYEHLKPRVLHDYQHSRDSLNAIAKKHGISTSTVGNWAAEAGLQRGRTRTGQQARREPVLSDYREGLLTVREIAQKHDLSETSVRNWAKQAGVTRQRPATPPRSRAKDAVLADYRAAELTVREIAQKHGVSQSSVNKWAREAGLTRRQLDAERLEQMRPQILHAYTTGHHSIAQIAERFGVHKSTVHRYVKQAGLGEQNRPRGARA